MHMIAIIPADDDYVNKKEKTTYFNKHMVPR